MKIEEGQSVKIYDKRDFPTHVPKIKGKVVDIKQIDNLDGQQHKELLLDTGYKVTLEG